MIVSIAAEKVRKSTTRTEILEDELFAVNELFGILEHGSICALELSITNERVRELKVSELERAREERLESQPPRGEGLAEQLG